MYSQPRPVPSKGALRVLRQLAYISSGTVAGAATLTLEERRRQTCVAKKIVDNAKKLKQHPRYRHNVAAQRLQDLEYSPFESYLAFDAQALNKHGKELQHEDNTSDSLHQPDAPRSEVLPSHVDKGYQKWVGKQASVYERSQPKVAQKAHPQRRTTGTEVRYIRPTANAAPKGADGVGPAHAIGVPNSFAPKAENVTQNARNSMPAPSKIPAFEPIDWDKTFDEYKRITGMRKDEDTLGLGLWRAKLSRDIPGGVGAFLQKFTPDVEGGGTKSQSPGRPAKRIWVHDLAVSLFRASAAGGHVEKALEMSRWMYSRSRLHRNDLQYLCESIQRRATKDSQHTSSPVDPSATLLNHVRDAALEKATGPASSFKVVAMAMLILDDPNAFVAPRDALLADYSDIQRSLHDLCSDMIRADKSDMAVELFTYSTLLLDDEKWSTSLAFRLFRSCLDWGQYAACTRLLLYLDSQRFSLSEAFVLVADSPFDPKELVKIYQHVGERGQLTEKAYRKLFFALAETSGAESAISVIQHLRPPFDNAVLNACRVAWHRLLTKQWASSKNFNNVLNTFYKMRQLAGLHQLEVEVCNTMIRICSEANKTETMHVLVDYLRSRDELQVDAETCCNWAITAAQNQNWERVEQILEVVDKERLASLPTAKRINTFLPLLRAYAIKHNPPEVWSFSSKLLERLAIDPTNAMVTIMMQSFIGDDSIDQVTTWIKQMHELGHEIEVSQRQVVDALNTYYHTCRPSYGWTGHLLRQIAFGAAHLLSPQLIMFHMDTIGQGIRQMAGRESRRLHRLIAEESLRASKQYLDWKRQTSSPVIANFVARPDSIDRAQKTINRDRKLGSEMLFEMSLDDPTKAIGLYQKSLSASGLPRSQFTLDLAVQASLQTTNTAEAMSTIQNASEAGMETTSALTPLFVNRFQAMCRKDPDEYGNARRLVADVLSFYKTMDEHNVHVTHHLAVSAASAMTYLGHTQRALSVLHSVKRSKWGDDAERNIVFMTVLLKTHLARSEVDQAEGVINKVLETGIRIDRKFRQTIQDGIKFLSTTDGRVPQSVVEDQQKRLEELCATCLQRRREQTIKAKRIGEQIVALLIAHAKKPATGSEAEELPFTVREEHSFKREDQQRRFRASRAR